VVTTLETTQIKNLSWTKIVLDWLWGGIRSIRYENVGYSQLWLGIDVWTGCAISLGTLLNSLDWLIKFSALESEANDGTT